MLVFWRLYRGFQKEEGLRKVQLKYFFIATLVGAIGGTPGFVLGYNLELYPLNPFGAYCMPLYSIICAYAILKYGLMRVRGAVRVLFAPAASLAIVGVLMPVIYNFFTPPDKKALSAGDVVFFSMWSIAAFHAVYRLIVIVMQKFIPQRDYEDLLFGYVKRLGRCNRVGDVFGQAMEILRDKDGPGVSSAVICWQIAEGQPYTAQSAFGVRGAERLKLPVKSQLIEMVEKRFIGPEVRAKQTPVLIRTELDKIYAKEDIRNMLYEMKKFRAHVSVPLIRREKDRRYLIGLIFLGKPLAGDLYSREDYDFFREVAEQTTMTLTHVESRERMAKMQRLAYLGNMAMGWGHQLNNILFRISMRGRIMANSLHDELDKTGLSDGDKRIIDAAWEDAENLVKAALQGGEVAKDFLRLTKTLKKKDLEKVDLRGQIEAAIKAVQERGKLGHVKVENNFPEGLPPVDGIGYCLEEAFKNLIDNAARAVMETRREGEGLIRIEGRISANKENVEIGFHDNGCGMSPEDVTNMGTPLFAVSGKEGDRTRHGLGVSVIYYYIMNVHKGNIHVESELGKGTSFYVTVPVEQIIREEGQETGQAQKGLGGKIN
jgi:signal transduction histidine kinase